MEEVSTSSSSVQSSASCMSSGISEGRISVSRRRCWWFSVLLLRWGMPSPTGGENCAGLKSQDKKEMLFEGC